MKKIVCVLLTFLLIFGVMSIGAVAAAPKIVMRTEAVGWSDTIHRFSPNDPPAQSNALQAANFFTNGTASTYLFYNTLDDTQKMIYETVLGDKTPRESFAFALQEPMTIPTNMNPGVYGLPAEAQTKILGAVAGGLAALLDDYPEMFWIGSFSLPSIRYGYAQTSTEAWTIYIFDIELALSLPNGYQSFQQVQVAYENMLAMMDTIQVQGNTRYEKLQYIANVVAHNASYDNTFVFPNIYAPTGVFLPPHLTVCEGYSESFKMLCDREGIPCIIVVGNASGGAHAWNYVQMEDGLWYGVDLTWMDQDSNSALYYDYFLVGRNTTNRHFGQTLTFEEEHTPTGLRYNTAYAHVYPTLSDVAYTEGLMLYPNAHATIDKSAKCITIFNAGDLSSAITAPAGFSLQTNAANSVLYVYKGDTLLETYSVVRNEISRLAGDLSNDGVTTALDARIALQAIANARLLDQPTFLAADVNADSQITPIDARWILQAAAGLRTLA